MNSLKNNQAPSHNKSTHQRTKTSATMASYLSNNPQNLSTKTYDYRQIGPNIIPSTTTNMSNVLYMGGALSPSSLINNLKSGNQTATNQSSQKDHRKSQLSNEIKNATKKPIMSSFIAQTKVLSTTPNRNGP